MDKRQDAAGHHRTGLTIREDSSVQISTSRQTGKPEIESVKPIFRPPERMSRPIKPYWAWIWLIVIFLVVVAWIFLYWYYSTHHIPSSALL